jgi:hypothetical protein
MGYFLVQTFYLKKLRRTLGVRIFFRFSMAYRAILSKGNKKARFSGLFCILRPAFAPHCCFACPVTSGIVEGSVKIMFSPFQQESP